MKRTFAFLFFNLRRVTMRYLNLMLMLVVLVVAPCLCGCGERAVQPDANTPSVGDSGSEFESTAEEADPDNP